MRCHWFRAVVLAGVTTSCSLAKPDAETESFGRRFIGLLESGDSAAITAVVDPSLTSYSAWENIMAFRDSLRAFHRDSTALVGWNVLQTPDAYRADLTFELHGRGWGLLAIRIDRRQGSLVATGVHLQGMRTSLAEANDFRFSGKSARHYLVLIAAFISFLFSLAAAILALRTPMPRRWLWAFVALIAYGQYTINWSTGEATANMSRFELFGAGFARLGLASPWLVSFALPVGAAYVLWRRHEFLRSESSVQASIASG